MSTPATASQSADDELNQKSVARARFLLRKLLIKQPEFMEHHTWASESDRWSELIYALVSRSVPEDLINVRRAVRTLQELDLLNPKALTAVDDNEERNGQIIEVLKEENFNHEEAQRAQTIIQEAATAVCQLFEGRLQFFLRAYAEIMVKDLCEHFVFSSLDQAQAEQAFSLWLQNSCNLPLSLFDNYVLEFCHHCNLSSPELVAAADELNLNLALVDDLIRGHLESDEKGVS
jgi:hypothetical protein